MYLSHRRKNRLHLIRSVSLNVCCLITIACATIQIVVLVKECGRDNRFSFQIDPTLQELAEVSTQIAYSIAGLIGIWTKRGPWYFVVLSLLICTTIALQIIDFVMGLFYMNKHDEDDRTYVERLFHEFSVGKIFANIKVNRLQSCKHCCGVDGPDDAFVKLKDGLLLSSCCPPLVSRCTRGDAYKAGCAEIPLEDEDKLITFHSLSLASILSQFYIYRMLLHTYV